MSTPGWRAEPGARIGRWTLDGLLAQGGGSVVWEAHLGERPDEIVAIKILVGDAPEASSRAAIAREARALAQVAHPGVVGLREALLDHEPPALVLERVRGRSLTRWIRRPQPPVAWIDGILRQLVEAVLALHRRGVAHRDLKPDHILVDDEDRAVILDLGAASLLDDPAGAAPSTPSYAPPAWFLGQGHDGALHDAYALGVVLYELLAGVRAAPGPVGGPRVAALDPGPTVDPALRDVVRALTEPDPAARLAVGRILSRLPAPASATLPTAGFDAALGAHAPPPMRVGRYILHERCGQGASGTVWRATDPGLERTVAVKLLHEGAQAAVASRRRFLREARAVARLAHPSLVRVLDAGVDGELPFVVMELVDGPNLATHLTERPMSPKKAARMGAQIAAALAHAHRAGIVHRDVKPWNILIASDGGALLTDFGVAHEMAEAATRLTIDGQVVGTPAYMAPEQARGDAVGPAADQYALGVVLYEALAGRRPTTGEHPAQVLHQVLSGALTPLRRAAPQVPVGLARVVDRALALAPGDRYPDLDAMAADLRLLADDTGSTIAPLALRVRARQALHRRRRLVAVVAVLALGVGVTAAAAASMASWRAHAAATEREGLAAERLDAATRRIGELVAADRFGEAEAAFDAFARLPEHQGTRALARAWMAEGQRRADRDPLRAREAYARAWVTAHHRDDQLDALIALGRDFQGAHDWPHLGLVVERIEERQPTERDDLAELRRDAALAVRDGARALQVAPGDRGAQLVAGLLAEATDTGWTHLMRVHPWPDGGLLLVSAERPRTLRLADRSSALPARRTVPVDHDISLAFPAGRDRAGRPLLVLRGQAGADHHLAAWTDEGLEEVFAWDGDPVTSVLVLEPPTAGPPQILATTTAYQRELLGLVEGSDGWRITHPHPGTDATNSDLSELRAVDLDGDGVDEVVLVAGAWGGYDVRTFGVGPEGSLKLRDRLRLGVVVSLARERGDGPASLLALKRDKYASQVQFRDPPHVGEPEALYRLAWSQGRLDIQDSWALPDGCHDVWSAELDGQPPAEMVVRCTPSSFVYAKDGDRWVAAPLADLAVVAVLDLDGDGDDELIVNDVAGGQRTWVLGSGGGAVPPQPRTTHAPARLLAGDPAVRRAWSRAEDLAVLGLPAPARAELEVLAALAPDLAGELLLRAGELAGEQGHLQDALDLWAQAATDPLVADRANQARVRLLVTLHRDEPARGIAAAALTAAPPEARPRWERQVAEIASPGAGSVVLDGDAQLDPSWRTGDPLGVRRTSSGVHFAGASRVLLSRPVRWDGGPVTVRLRGSTRSLGYGAGLRVALRPVDDPDPRALSLGVSAGGGGGQVTMRQACLIRDVQWLDKPHNPSWTAVPVHSADEPVPLDARFDVRPDLLAGACAWQRGGSRVLYRLAQAAWRADPPYRPGVYALEIVAGAAPGTEAPWVHVVLDEVVVEGVDPLPMPPPSPVELAMLALADGRPDDALAHLPQVADPSQAAFLRAVALDDLGRSEAAAEALRRALRGREIPEFWLTALVRGRAGRFDEVLAAELGERWPPLMATAWSGTLRHTPDDPVLDAPVLASLDGLIGADFQEQPDVLVVLLRRRAIALRRAGRLADARRHLERARELVSGRGGAGSLESELSRDLAAVLLAGNDLDAAMDALAHAVQRAPAPEVFADRLDADHALDPLRAHPRWGPIVDRARRP